MNLHINHADWICPALVTLIGVQTCALPIDRKSTRLGKECGYTAFEGIWVGARAS